VLLSWSENSLRVLIPDRNEIKVELKQRKPQIQVLHYPSSGTLSLSLRHKDAHVDVTPTQVSLSLKSLRHTKALSPSFNAVILDDRIVFTSQSFLGVLSNRELIERHAPRNENFVIGASGEIGIFRSYHRGSGKFHSHTSFRHEPAGGQVRSYELRGQHVPVWFSASHLLSLKIVRGHMGESLLWTDLATLESKVLADGIITAIVLDAMPKCKRAGYAE
jgi:hypothetical protein